jgi:hypothetical protein
LPGIVVAVPWHHFELCTGVWSNDDRRRSPAASRAATATIILSASLAQTNDLLTELPPVFRRLSRSPFKPNARGE